VIEESVTRGRQRNTKKGASAKASFNNKVVCAADRNFGYYYQYIRQKNKYNLNTTIIKDENENAIFDFTAGAVYT
jgi:hypothetical protein